MGCFVCLVTCDILDSFGNLKPYMLMETNLVECNDNYCIGIEEIDMQHESLFNISSRAWQSINKQDEAVSIISIYPHTGAHHV